MWLLCGMSKCEFLFGLVSLVLYSVSSSLLRECIYALDVKINLAFFRFIDDAQR
jgi:hypothetical protein